MPDKKLFISHAEKDKELAVALVDLLETGTSFKNVDVLFSSLEEKGVSGGEDFATYIKSQIQTPEAAIILLSPNYFLNRFCLYEMGSILALTQNVFPLLVSPLTSKHVQGIVPVAQIDRIESTDDLNKLVAQLQKNLELADLNLPRWAMKRSSS